MSSSPYSDWKEEPVSPQYSEESWVSEDTALYWTALEQKVETEFSSCETKAEVASRLLEGLDQLEDLDEWIKDEPYSNWLEEKILPIFDDVVEPARSAPLTPIVKSEFSKLATVPDTQSLLQEFETVFDAVEMTRGTLTPPQSPPYQPLLTTLEPLPAEPALIFPEKLIFTESDKQLISNVLGYPRTPILLQLDYPPSTPQPDVARELAVVDELVRTRAEDMVSEPSYYSSDPSSPGSSSSSNFGDSSSDDPEWIPETIDPDELESIASKPTGRKRQKPYSRSPPEEKKSRKKEQNKNAATRYRMKKKAEVEVVLEEERKLAKTNDGLENNIGDLQREIKYLKGLMRELFKAKGLIN